MVLSTPAPVRTLLSLGLRRTLREASADEIAVIVDRGCAIFKRRGSMLWDYFSIKIEPDENGVFKLYCIPLLLDR